MRALAFYGVCFALFLACIWLIRLLITGISPHYGFGFASGVVVTLLLVYTAEKLGFKEPRY